MANDKVWHKIVIATEENKLTITPTETFDGIILETKELNNSFSPRMYLNETEMEFLIQKMREMMQYVKQ